MSTFAPVGWITPAGVSIGPRKVPLNRQFNGDDVTHDIDPNKFAVNAGNIFAKVITNL